MHSGSSPDQLELAAPKSHFGERMRARYQVMRRDLSTLLNLLLRLTLREKRWGSRFHFGAFGEANPRDEELADILVNGLCGDREEDDLTADQIITAMNMLVSGLYLKFRQI